MPKGFLFFAFTAFALILLVTGPSAAHAAAGCDLSAQASELAVVQADTSMDELEQLNAEIAARRKLMQAAIGCDERDIAARKETLERLPESLKTSNAYRDILEDLTGLSQYYEQQKAGTEGLTLRELKSLSRAIAAWRRATYLPLVTWTDNFLIWTDNQELLERAATRLAQVNHAAFSLKLVNQEEITGLFNKAKTSFDTALAQNTRAQEALDQGRATNGLTHTKASLQALADVYQALFALQEALQKIVK